MTKRKVKYTLDDAFPTKSVAKASARDRRKTGDLVRVRKVKQGRLKYGLFVGNRQRKQRKRR